ncbi:MAG: alpha-L-fucosidase [Reichenbachiella sp.]
MLKISQLIAIILLLQTCRTVSMDDTTEAVEQLKYEANWESLAKHNEEPDWFLDAKLGIYFHWGVYSVPAYSSEWYPRWMHFEGRSEFDYHVENYGHPSDFGYHDLVPLFTADKFDAAEWVDLFQQAGAKFAGPVAEHHDGFAMWDSEITPWNAKDKGPKKDITGLIATELRKRDMKLITTFHHSRNLQRFDTATYEHISVLNNKEIGTSWSSHYPSFEGLAPMSDDDELKYLYGNIPEEQWLSEVWLGKINEVVDKYNPDIIWFDAWLDDIPEEYRLRMAADYFNKAEAMDQEVVIVRKQDDLPLDMSVDDHEKTRENEIAEKYWMTDETVSTGSWCYTSDLKIKESKELIHILIDITSKNGVLLLNISPKADGSIPKDQKGVLLDFGKWLDVYGEAIYETRPWYTFGEGPTKEPEITSANRNAFLDLRYSNQDIRYTKKGNYIYAIQLGKPAEGDMLSLTAFSSKDSGLGEIKSVVKLGSDEQVIWSMYDSGLSIESTTEDLNNVAQVYKIELKI